MPPPLEHDILYLMCYFSSYEDDTPNSNSRWSFSNIIIFLLYSFNGIIGCLPLLRVMMPFFQTRTGLERMEVVGPDQDCWRGELEDAGSSGLW